MRDRCSSFPRIAAASSCVVAASLWVGCASSTPGSASAGGAAIRGSEPPGAAARAAYPACVVASVEKGSRFDDADYFDLMAGAGVAAAPPERLFERMKAAADRGETYKALYLARLLTASSPGLSGGWANRAALAGSLGLSGEQAAAATNAGKAIGEQVAVPASFVPGVAIAHRPASLPDWAAAMSLLADDSALRDGGAALLAVRDDVSGLRTVADGDSRYAVGKPIAIDDLLPNSFVLLNAKAMSQHNTDGGKLALSIFMAAMGGMSAAYGNTANSAALSESAGRLAGESTVVASHWKGGSFTARTYPGGQVKNAADKPKPSGEYQATGLPQPLVWASGGSLRPTAMMALVESDGEAAKIRTRRYDRTPAGASKEMKIPSLLYPRLASLCHSNGGRDDCTVPVSLMELMLQRADVDALVADRAVASRVGAAGFDFDDWSRLYASGEPITLETATASRGVLVGYDRHGACYEVSSAPDHWFAPATQGR